MPGRNRQWLVEIRSKFEHHDVDQKDVEQMLDAYEAVAAGKHLDREHIAIIARYLGIGANERIGLTDQQRHSEKLRVSKLGERVGVLDSLLRKRALTRDSPQKLVLAQVLVDLAALTKTLDRLKKIIK